MAETRRRLLCIKTIPLVIIALLLLLLLLYVYSVNVRIMDMEIPSVLYFCM